MERTGIVTMKGNPMTLVGNEIKVGDKAPDFTVSAQTLAPVTLKDYAGKIKVISVTPSLDTPVCDFQLRRLNTEVASMGDDIVMLNISMDLPFAIKRFCTVAEIDKAIALSDYKEASFGTAFGVLIKELRLLARAVFVVDKNDVVTYVEIVPEATNAPDYEKLIAFIKK
ncbi:thiol peroxidase [Seleniivibrio woodruffii]|uniref:Thiol peroxidase n=1 Tax=Seleniivibrio woodruffii TaxID=1078050 RepID=A0A4R1K5R8_9BACT|nr:thiol peroxidase [Seleniivibrio woodruffii]TCK59545.1 peroxiredoxin [Seleniivibrio woodruffii]TVZ35414.1 thiol peroxidase, atypical 2-Cys peroxiredoxin [Seleniivibrio woodruffii]